VYNLEISTTALCGILKNSAPLFYIQKVKTHHRKKTLEQKNRKQERTNSITSESKKATYLITIAFITKAHYNNCP